MTDKTVTYGRKILLDLIERRQLVRFCRTYVGNAFSLMYVSYVARGKFAYPSLRFIYKVQEQIHPALWFYYTDEKLPPLKRSETHTSFDWKPAPDYGSILSVPSFIAYCKKHSYKTVSLELFTAYIAEMLGTAAVDTETVLSVSALSAWCRKNGIAKISARTFTDYINEYGFGKQKQLKPFDYTDSKNFIALKEIKNLWKWCSEHEQKFVTVNALLKGTRSLTPQRIMAMKAILPPEGWFTKG